MVTKRNKRSNTRRTLILITGLIVVILFLLWLTNPGYIFRSKPTANVDTAHTSSQISSDSKANNGVKKPSTNNGINQETSTDNHGTITTPIASNQSQWSISQSGAIIVKEPITNSTIQSGVALEGSATIGQVQYTLIDNQVGVISQGTISVVNGTFSASMNFQTTASSGRLDVYSTDPNGKEINLVEIPVSF